ncbi:MAG: glutaredoxin 3 [Pseudomonadota bacterium]
MKPVEIYTSALCGFCHSAKRLLSKKGVDFTEISVDGRPDVRGAMIDRAGGKTSVPQIFAGADHLGGCDELYALERDGKLDALLAG